MRPFIYLFLILLFASWCSNAQTNFSLSGKVIDINGLNANEVILQLYNSKDSSMVKYAFTNEGLFSFDSIKQGDYMLKISSLEYESNVQMITLIKNMTVKITLTPKEKSLKDVKIVAAKKQFTYKNGNMKVNIENTILANEANTVDLLSKLPTVQLSTDKESISLIGKGTPLIYINNQKSTLSDLSALSVNDIKSIEIIQHPSSKYEAEGRAVILVTRKLGTKEGIRVEVNENMSVKRYFNNQLGTNLSYKKKKLELKLNAKYNYAEHWESNQHAFAIENKDIQLNNHIVSFGPRNQLDIGGGLYYQLNTEDYLSIYVNKRIPKERYHLNTSSTQKIHSTQDSLFSFTDNHSHRPFFTSNINYNKALKKINGQLFVGGQFSRFTRNVSTGVFNDSMNTGLIQSQDRIQNFHVDGFTGRVDFEKNFKHKIKYECGVSATHTASNSVLDIQEYAPNQRLYTNFKYHENDIAAYNQLSGTLRKVNYTAGVRAENTQIQSGFKDSTSLLIDKNYVQFFPKVDIDIPIDSTKTISLNYAKSIQRPNYSFANQISTYINPYFEFANNIRIQPSITHELAANLQYNERSLRLSVYTIQNPVYSSVEYNEAENKVTLLSTNFKSEKGTNITLTLPLKYKFWSSTNIADASISSVKDSRAIKIATKPCFYFYSRNQFTFPMAYTFVLSGWWTSNKFQGSLKEFGMYSVDLGVSKTFLKKLNCTISYNDIFRSMNYRIDFTVNQVNAKSLYYEDNKELAIALKYSFGHIKDSKYKNKEADDNLKRIR